MKKMSRLLTKASIIFFYTLSSSEVNMKRLILIAFFLSVTTAAYCSDPVVLPYSQSFDSWTAVNPLSNGICPFHDIDSVSDGACSGGQSTQVSASAARGGTGLGIRWWAGTAKNDNSGQFAFVTSTSWNEIWCRFYLRFQTGYAWQAGSDQDIKLWWVDNGNPNDDAITGGYSSAGGCSQTVRNWNQNSSTEVVCGTGGWFNTIMGGSTGDGQWHCYEFHLKHHTTTSPYNGVEEVWIDGNKVMNQTAVDTGRYWPRNRISFLVNQDTGANSGCKYIDFDDLAMSTTGYIGRWGAVIQPIQPALLVPHALVPIIAVQQAIVLP